MRYAVRGTFNVMTQAEFIALTEKKLKSLLDMYENSHKTKLSVSKERIGAKEFEIWARQELHEQLKSNTLNNISQISKSADLDVNHIAMILGGRVAMEYVGIGVMEDIPFDWQEQWNVAGVILSNIPHEKTKAWPPALRSFFSSYTEAIRVDAYIRALRRSLEPEKKTSKIVPAVWALYYIYRRETGSFDRFTEGEKVKQIQALAEKHSVDAKNLQTAFSDLRISKFRVAEEKGAKIKDLQNVINMLEDYPDAQRMAIDELNLIRAKS